MDKDKVMALFVKDPSLLVEICREVVDHFDIAAADANTGEMTAQLREISAAMDRLDKQGINIPDVLRVEKTRLAAALGLQDDAATVLKQLAGEFEDILKDLRGRLGMCENGHSEPKKPQVKRQRLPKIDKAILRENLIQALKKRDGKARATEAIEAVGRQLEGKLLPADLAWLESTREYLWQNNVRWERNRMVQDGVLRNDSPRGIWELNEDKT